MTGLEKVCKRLGLELEAKLLGTRCDADGWQHQAWAVTLSRGAETYSTLFRQGLAHADTEPTVANVLSCLMSDASSGESGSFEAFCSEFGYDTDSRRAEATYRACQESAEAMRRMLGVDFDVVALAASEY